MTFELLPVGIFEMKERLLMRRWRVFLLIFLVLLSLASVTEAVNWVNLGNSETFTLYVDSE